MSDTLNPEVRGRIVPRKSWPREATPTDLAPAWAGEFVSFDDWVSFASKRLTGTYDPLMGNEVPSVCIDAFGRRCTLGGHFKRAHEGNVKVHTLDRLDSFIRGTAGKRLTYAELIA